MGRASAWGRLTELVREKVVKEWPLNFLSSLAPQNLPISPQAMRNADVNFTLLGLEVRAACNCRPE